MSLGKKIKESREFAQLTQDQAAEALGITKGAISQWEQNKTTPTLTQFRAFCSITNASADELLLDKELRGVEKRINALPDAMREYVLLAIEFSESIKEKIPIRFMVAPTKATYQAFHQHLVELSDSTKGK